MPTFGHFTRSRSISAGLAGFSLAMLAGFATPTLAAQTLVADYPLLIDLNDATANHGPAQLLGNPTPPSPPSNGVCLNGVYRLSTSGGQDVRTPDIPTLDSTDFQIEVEFKLTAMPTSTRGFPVLMAGSGWRWIGIYVQQNGTVGLKYNNSSFSWSSTTLTSGIWYSAVVKYESGNVRLYVDGAPVHSAAIGTLNTGSNQNFVTNDYSNGLAFHGCIRNLRLWNDTNLSAGLFTHMTRGCAGLTISPGGSPNLTGNVTLKIGGPGSGGAAFLYGFTPADLPLCAKAPCSLGLNTAGVLVGSSQLIPIPNTTALIDAVAYFQGATVSTNGCFLLAFTDTIAVTVGQ